MVPDSIHSPIADIKSAAETRAAQSPDFTSWLPLTARSDQESYGFGADSSI